MARTPAPVPWARSSLGFDPAHWNGASAPRQLAKSGDPFAGVLGAGIDPEALLAGLLRRLDRSTEKS